jgi:15,16-dihydrobiliverdin:ferredoxin oxidoreductase
LLRLRTFVISFLYSQSLDTSIQCTIFMYKPFVEHLQQELFQKFDLQSRAIPAGLEHKVSDRGKTPSTIQSWCYQCPELRKIRYTHMVAGETLEVFNSVMYPSYQYQLPFLGVDFLSFGSVKNLIVMDFQPLFQDADYIAKYIAPLATLHEKYPDLSQNLEMKFYDANQYFSKYLLFAKVQPDVIPTRVFSAFQAYLDLYWQMLENETPIEDPVIIARVEQAQNEYDQYSADRDPAHGLFSSHFGNDWANRFLFEFLFENAKQLVSH